MNPITETEADVAAEFSHRIKLNRRLRIYLEVVKPSKHHRSGSFRIDALITFMTGLGKQIEICAVEFKRGNRHRRKIHNLRGRQINAYRDLGLPFCYCYGIQGIDATIAQVDQHIVNRVGRLSTRGECSKEKLSV